LCVPPTTTTVPPTTTTTLPCEFDPSLEPGDPLCVPPTTTTLPPTTTTLPPTTTTTIVDSNPPEPTLAVEALSPVCIADAPYVEYRLALTGSAFPGSAKLTFRSTVQPDFEETVIVTELSGRVVYPGATVDSNGNATDWPGWKFENGEWKEDPSDAFLRQGLTVTFEVNPTATATVTYPPATSACAGPPAPQSFPPPGTVVPVPQPLPQLPGTGSDSNTLVQLAGLLLAGGLLVFGATRPRRPTRN
jgi:LPXTG-motif cell wall-anchored protein